MRHFVGEEGEAVIVAVDGDRNGDLGVEILLDLAGRGETEELESRFLPEIGNALQKGGDLRRVRKLLEQERELGLEPPDLVLERTQIRRDRLLLPDFALKARQLG